MFVAIDLHSGHHPLVMARKAALTTKQSEKVPKYRLESIHLLELYADLLIPILAVFSIEASSLAGKSHVETVHEIPYSVIKAVLILLQRNEIFVVLRVFSASEEAKHVDIVRLDFGFVPDLVIFELVASQETKVKSGCCKLTTYSVALILKLIVSFIGIAEVKTSSSETNMN